MWGLNYSLCWPHAQETNQVDESDCEDPQDLQDHQDPQDLQDHQDFQDPLVVQDNAVTPLNSYEIWIFLDKIHFLSFLWALDLCLLQTATF